MKLEEIVRFSLGFMFKKPRILIFFVPVFLLNVMAAMAMYILPVNPTLNMEDYADVFNPATPSGSIVNVFLIPQIQTIFGIFLLMGILGWILNSYAGICIYRAAESEYGKKEWGMMGILKKSIGILPRYLLLLIIVGIVLIIPALLMLIPAIILAIVLQSELSNSVILMGLSILLILFFAIPTVISIVYLAVRLYAALPALVIEGKGIIESLKRSWSLTAGSFWYVLGYAVLFLIVITIISMVFSIPVAIISPAAPEPGDSGCQSDPLLVITSFLQQLIGFYTTTAWISFSYMIYLSLIGRKDKRNPGEVRGVIVPESTYQ